jgi:LysM repeat protein
VVTPKVADEPAPKVSNSPEKGFEHEVKSGQTLSAIIQAYRDQGVKVTLKQVLDANPTLKPERMKAGQKIFIPAPTQ